MEFSHVFYKEIPLDEDNIFSANLTKNNEVVQVKFKKSKIYAIEAIEQVTKTLNLMFLYQTLKKKEALNDILRTYAEAKNKFNLDLKKLQRKLF